MRGATGDGEGRTSPFIFQSTLPMRGATTSTRQRIISTPDFNPHSPCGERPASDLLSLLQVNFNPHSPCGERPAFGFKICRFIDFNPHSPCGERLISLIFLMTQNLFQSTLPMRGATTASDLLSLLQVNFNPHSPCGERRR